MRKWQIPALVFALLVACVEAKASDKEGVMTHMAEFFAAVNVGHTDASHVDAIPFSKHSHYNANGALLSTFDPILVKAWLKGAVSGGANWSIQPTHQHVEVYGNAAVHTCYENVNINPPEGEQIRETNRVTRVLVKQKGEWKVVHAHASHLIPVNPE